MAVVPLALRRTPLEVLATLAREPGAFLLDVPDETGRVTLLGCAPVAELSISASSLARTARRAGSVLGRSRRRPARSAHVGGALPGGRGPDPRVSRRRRRLPGEPHAAVHGSPVRARVGAGGAPRAPASGAVRGIYRLRQSAARRQLARALSPAARAMRRDAADQGHPPARRPARPRRRPRRRAARRSERAGRARDDRRPRAERPRPGVRDGQRRRGTVRRGREPPDGASPRVDRRRPAAPRRRARRPPARHLSRRLDHGRAQGACHGDHPRARAVAARAVHRRLRLPRPAGRPGARARHPHGDRLGRRGALPRGRRHRRRLRSRARARGDVAQDRGAAPRARRRDGPQLRAVLVWLNGRLVDGARAHVSAFDRGLLHGDGAYDTWRTYAGRPFAVPAHVRRLAAAARALALPGPGAAALWERRTRVLVARTRLPDAALRLTLTRGATGDALIPARPGRT